MNLKLLNVLAAGMLVAAVGCNKTEKTTVTAETPSGEKKVEVEYSYAKKDDMVAKMKSEMANVNDEMKKLGDKIANGTEKTKEEAKPKLEALKEKAKNLDVYIDKAQNATESTWDDVKSGSKKAMDDMKQSFNDARAWVSEKIAP